MNNMHCVYREHAIHAQVFEHPGLPTPWEGACQITQPDGHSTRRIPLPLNYGFLADLESAQRASLAHGKWLVDQHLDSGRELPG